MAAAVQPEQRPQLLPSTFGSSDERIKHNHATAKASSLLSSIMSAADSSLSSSSARTPSSRAAPQMEANASLDSSEVDLRNHLLAAASPQPDNTQPNSAQRPQPASAHSSSRPLAPSPPSSSRPPPPPDQAMDYAPQPSAPQHRASLDTPQYAMQHHPSSSHMSHNGTQHVGLATIGGVQGIAPMPEGGPPPASPPSQHPRPDGRSNPKRELSQSKRAAQNRAAQRAFRQRKESYIRKLEDDVRNAAAVPAMTDELHRTRHENYQLRDYIVALQSRLLDVSGDFPAPPANLELRDPRQLQNHAEPGQAHMSEAGGVDRLQEAAAQAEAGGFADAKRPPPRQD